MRKIEIEYNGELNTLTQWSEILGIKYQTLYRRLHYKKLDVKEAFETPLVRPEKIIIGGIYGDFKVLEVDNSIHKNRSIYYKCECIKCNNVTVRDAYQIKKNRQCFACTTIHKIPDSRLYSIYRNMKYRCYSKNNKRYKDYGGRGIIICKDWLIHPENFYNWAINNGYRDDLTIDRIDNDGNYEPNNCRWITPKKQANNRRTNKFINISGNKYSIKEFSEQFNISYQTALNHYKKEDIDYFQNIFIKSLDK